MFRSSALILGCLLLLLLGLAGCVVVPLVPPVVPPASVDRPEEGAGNQGYDGYGCPVCAEEDRQGALGEWPVCSIIKWGYGAVHAYADAQSTRYNGSTFGSGQSHRMKEALAVVKYEMAIPDANGRFQPTRAVPWSNPKPTVIIDLISAGDIAMSGTSGAIHITGTVRDAFSDIVKEGAADLRSVSVFAFSQQVATASLTRVEESTSTLRPYAHRFTFDTTVTVPLSSAGQTIRVSTEPNAFGNSGEASLGVVMSRQVTVSATMQGIDFFLEPQPKGSMPSAATVMQIWAGIDSPTVIGVLPRVAGSIAFCGTWDAAKAKVNVLSEASVVAGSVRVFPAELYFNDQTTASVTGSFVETAPGSNQFHYLTPGTALSAGDALVVSDVVIHNGTDAGSFVPFSFRVMGPDQVLEGETGNIRGNEYPLEKQADGKYFYTGSDVRILVATPKTPPSGLVGTYLVLPSDSTKLDKSGINYSESQLSILDLIAGEKNAIASITMAGSPLGNQDPPFFFQNGDMFEIESQPVMTVAGVHAINSVDGTNIRKVSVISGTIADVTAPPGLYDVKYTPIGRPAIIIPKAVVVAKPTKIIIVNCYGHKGSVIDIGGHPVLNATPEDPNMVAAGEALAKKYSSEPGQLGRTFDVKLIKVGTGKRRNPQSHALEDFVCDVASWAQLPGYLKAVQPDGKPRVGLGTVIGVDSLGHGTPIIAEPYGPGHLPDSFWGVIGLPNPDPGSIDANTGDRMSIRVFNNVWPTIILRPGTADQDPVTMTVHLPLAFPSIPNSTFAEYFAPHLAVRQPVTINLFHCYSGKGGTATLPVLADRQAGDLLTILPVSSAIRQLADALYSRGSTNVTVIGGDGFSEFSRMGATHGGTISQAASSTGGHP